MAEENGSVRSLWTPLRDINLLLPSATIAEVINYQVPANLPDTPEWVLGAIRWRDRTIPVVSLEVLCGHKLQANLAYSRLLIVNSIRPESPVCFYAIVTAGLPRQLQFDADTADGMESSTLDALHCRVSMNNAKAVVPDLEYIQQQLERHLDAAA